MVDERYVNGRRVVDVPDRLTVGVVPHPSSNLAETRILIKLEDEDKEVPATVRESFDDPSVDSESVLRDFLKYNEDFQCIELRHFLSAEASDSDEKEGTPYGIYLEPEQLMQMRQELSKTARYIPEEMR